MRAFRETGATCLAWAILDNHYHVLFRCPGPPGPVFARLNSAIAWRVTHKTRRDHGAVFQNRYFSDPCTDEASLLRRFAYVLGNPIHHHVVPTVEALCGYEWSGLAELLGLRPARWIDVDAALSAIAPDPNHARRTLLELLEQRAARWAADEGDPDDEESLADDVPSPAACSTTVRPPFASPSHAGDELRDRRTTLRLERWTPQRLIAPACAITGGNPAAVHSGGQSRPDVAARSMVAFVACDVAGWTMRETAKVLGVGETAMINARRRGLSRLAAAGLDPVDVLERSRGPA